MNRLARDTRNAVTLLRMKRVARYLFNALTAISLLLCLATAALWVRSYWVADTYWWLGSQWLVHAGSSGGWFFVDAGRRTASPPPRRYIAQPPTPSGSMVRRPWPGEPGIRHHRDLGFAAWFVTDGGTVTSFATPQTTFQIRFFHPRRDFYLRHWSLAAVWATLPAI